MNKNKPKFTLDDFNDSTNIEKIDRNALKNFAKGALTHSTEEDDPNELPTYNFRLRLNKFQINLLKRVADLEHRSMSNLIKFILMEELQKRVKL